MFQMNEVYFSYLMSILAVRRLCLLVRKKPNLNIFLCIMPRGGHDMIKYGSIVKTLYHNIEVRFRCFNSAWFSILKFDFGVLWYGKLVAIICLTSINIYSYNSVLFR